MSFYSYDRQVYSYDRTAESDETASQDVQSFIRHEHGEYCVHSEHNPDWNGGCYKTKGKAEKRLKQVEYFKHNK